MNQIVDGCCDSEDVVYDIKSDKVPALLDSKPCTVDFQIDQGYTKVDNCKMDTKLQSFSKINVKVEFSEDGKKEESETSSDLSDEKPRLTDLEYTSELQSFTEADDTVNFSEDRKKFSKPDNVKIECPVCKKFYKTELCLKYHLCGSDCKKNNFVCNHCRKRFKYFSSLKEHFAVHSAKKTEDMGMKCPVCNRSYKTELHLKYHLCGKISTKRFICDLCSTRFRDFSKLKYHLSNHSKVSASGKNQVECPVCKRFYATKLHLKYHLCDSDGRKNSKLFICNHCNMEFKYLSLLKRHFAMHSDKKKVPPKKLKSENFECSVCKKSYQTELHLKYHVCGSYGEKKEKRFVCNQCSRTFKYFSKLKDHLLIHSGERPHVCNVCGKAFNLKSNLKLHYQRMHSDEYLKECWECGKKFTNKSSLKRHLVTHNNHRPFACKDCRKSFKLKSTLKGHLRIHCNEKPYICEICGNAFRRKAHLNKHLRSRKHKAPGKGSLEACKPPDESFNCKNCGLKFENRETLRNHEQTHVKIGAYVCSECENVFDLKVDLTQHYLKCHLD